MLPKHVNVVEVGPRDGLQNETTLLNVTSKVKLIKDLINSGLNHIEVGSFVSDKSVPQMSNTEEVLYSLGSHHNVNYSVLVPNITGMVKAEYFSNLTCAVFTSVSETFCKKNIHCNIKESLSRFEEVISKAKVKGFPVRAYISCVLGCPYEGEVDNKMTVQLAKELIDMGCYQVSLGDTIGIGNITQVKKLIHAVGSYLDLDQIAVHFHDTYGQALVNVYAALEMGVATIDSSVAGLGGCPYAKGSSGNLATEDLIYMLHGLGITTGVDLDKLISTGHAITRELGIQPRSKLSLAKLT